MSQSSPVTETPLPTYGNLPWDQLGQDVMEAMTGSRSNYEFPKDGYPGHAIVGINFNSLARIIDKYRLRGHAQKSQLPDRDAIYRAIESNVRSEPDKHFIDRRWMVGINDAVDAILALSQSSTDCEGK